MTLGKSNNISYEVVEGICTYIVALNYFELDITYEDSHHALRDHR